MSTATLERSPDVVTRPPVREVIISADSPHVTEPHDLWAKRLPATGNTGLIKRRFLNP